MKTTQILFIAIFSLIVSSCTSNKKSQSEQLYNTTWELEYISGPRIAFDGLYPEKKPQITFNKEHQKVEGNNSCNGYTADYTLNEDAISFGEPGPTTMMYCGEGESVFLNMMKKINNFNIDTDGKLNLRLDDVSVMKFHKIQQE
ncbi:META domain-containing protein [Zhouia spongiae]|uniref:META domain-containing protein n=1 Tax=Zhouia spongiae TaxID=2202721 RepID=A0ABY3YRJ7_9FLAO|nr:META domain-containing protein [Zhouia spongiae]UNZ00165.1 META domain-containing protein [Zhouia spongiae]